MRSCVRKKNISLFINNKCFFLVLVLHEYPTTSEIRLNPENCPSTRNAYNGFFFFYNIMQHKSK